MHSQLVVWDDGVVRLGKLLAVMIGWVGGMICVPMPANAADAPPRVVFHNSILALPAKALPSVQFLRNHQMQQRMELEISLRMRNLGELKERIGAGQMISRAEMERRYLPLEASYKQLHQWLLKEGFEIVQVDSNRLAFFIRGTLQQIHTSLGADMVGVEIDGVTYNTARSAPSLPGEVADPVLGINGLQPYLQLRKRVASFQPVIANRPPYLIHEITRAYNADNLGVTGQGQKIGILIDTVPDDSDLIEFWAINGIPQNIGNIEKVNVSGQTLPPLGIEETLDVEWSSGIAPGAKIRIYAAGSLTFVNINKALLRIINDLPLHPQMQQLSISLGLGEAYMPPATLMTESQYLAIIAGSGVSIFVSSGDEGSNPDTVNDGDARGPLQVEFFASDPSVTAVGGTNLYLNVSTGNLSSEMGWVGSGGGLSRYFDRPVWQRGAGVPSNNARLVPDLSLVGAIATPAYIYYKGEGVAVAGTSWSAPTWAGFCAMINEARSRQALSPLGLLNPRIYPLLGTHYFRDIVTGKNGAYQAGRGYDLVTGVGVPDVKLLLQALTVQNGAPSITTLTPSLGAFFAPVTIDGFNLAGVTAIKFNGVPASISSNSATQVVTAVPEGALSGPVTVITTNGTAESPGAFTVTGPAAPPVAGVYEGLLQSKREDGSGYLKVNVARTRWFTAQLKLEGAVYRFSGLFNAGGAFRAKLKRGGVEVLVELSFTGANAAPRIAGVIAADGRLYSMNAAPAIYSTAVPAPQQGRYTVLVQPDPGTYPSPQFPQGYGYATMRVSASGSVKLVGKLGDLQPFSSSSLLKDGALFPLYASLYKKPFGSVAGELAFTQNSALSDFEGTLLWIKPAQPAGVHPEGFSMKAVPVIGSRYVAPSKGTRALDWNAGSGHLTLKEGYLSTVLNAQLTLSLLNKLSVESSDAARLTVSISPSTGWFQGSFIHPFTEANVRFAGALFQAGKSAGGAFICADQSGMVTMSVCPP